MLRSIRKLENLHIACWLVKDTCWVMDLQFLGIFMIFPTLSLAFYITFKFRKIRSELFHNAAVCLWIMANTVWMIGEFFFDDTLRPYAMVFFISGLVVLLYYHTMVYRKLASYSDSAGKI